MMNFGLNNPYLQQYGFNSQMPQMSQIQPQDARIWVQGEIGAKAYIVAPMNTVVLWDSETPTIYIKTVSSAGFPQIQRISYKMEEEHKTDDEFVTRAEFERRIKEMQNVSKSDSNDSAVSEISSDI